MIVVNVHNQDHVDRRKNSFTIIRYLAAFQVLLGHVNVHLDLNIPSFLITLSRIVQGVPVFFVLSGFLIWNSLQKNETFNVYFRRRVLRIYPALWIGMVCSVVSICILYMNDINVIDLILFVFTQSTFMQFWTPNSLRGFGCGTPNGSLWTITVTVQFYIVIWLLHKLLRKKKNDIRVWLIIFGGALIVSVLSPYLKNIMPSEILYKLYTQTVVPYFFVFFLGCFISQFFDLIIPYLKKFWWIFGIVDLLVVATGIDIMASYGIIQTISLTLFIIGFAYKFAKFSAIKDITYEIYIYHMIFVNIFIELGMTQNIIYLFAVVLCTIIAAVIGNKAEKLIRNRLFAKRKNAEIKC